MNESDYRLLDAALPELAQVQLKLDTLGGERTLSYRAAGDKDAPPVVLLHGIGSNSAGYRAQLAGLAAHHRVIAWNAPGYGQSSPFTIAKPTAVDYAHALLAFMTALGISRATIVGSSWGSVIATTFAAHYARATDALVLAAPNIARAHLPPAERAAARDALMRSAAAQSPEARTAVVDALLSPHAPAQVRALAATLRDAVTPTGWEHAVDMLLSVHTPTVIASVEAPVSIVIGNRDRVAPLDEHARPIHEAAHRSTLHVFNGIGHLPKLEAPAAFNAIVLEAAAT